MKRVAELGRLVQHKLKPKYWGPFLVIEVNPNGVTYILEKVSEPNKEYRLRAHHTQLKIWHDPPSYILHHPSNAELAEQDITGGDQLAPVEDHELMHSDSSTSDGICCVPMQCHTRA